MYDGILTFTALISRAEIPGVPQLIIAVGKIPSNPQNLRAKEGGNWRRGDKY